jgi:hypothetical protein
MGERKPERIASPGFAGKLPDWSPYDPHHPMHMVRHDHKHIHFDLIADLCALVPLFGCNSTGFVQHHLPVHDYAKQWAVLMRVASNEIAACGCVVPALRKKWWAYAEFPADALIEKKYSMNQQVAPLLLDFDQGPGKAYVALGNGTA